MDIGAMLGQQAQKDVVATIGETTIDSDKRMFICRYWRCFDGEKCSYGKAITPSFVVVPSYAGGFETAKAICKREEIGKKVNGRTVTDIEFESVGHSAQQADVIIRC